jgi:hypothetical protein
MKTRFVDIHPQSEDFVRMQQFAKSFGHEIHPWRNGKVVAFERDEKTFGYADIIYLPIAFPAFHPEVTTPRGVMEVVHGWRAAAQLLHGGEGFIGVPLEGMRQTFPKEMIEGTGYSRMNREIYQVT